MSQSLWGQYRALSLSLARYPDTDEIHAGASARATSQSR
jgi:hypothetical protein